jgi:hypothetical protein
VVTTVDVRGRLPSDGDEVASYHWSRVTMVRSRLGHGRSGIIYECTGLGKTYASWYAPGNSRWRAASSSLAVNPARTFYHDCQMIYAMHDAQTLQILLPDA